MNVSFRKTLTLCAVSAALMVSQTSYAFSLSDFVSSLTGGNSNQTTANENLASNPLADAVSQKLNVTPQQAAGGIGALLAAAGSELNGQDSKQLNNIIPGMDALRNAIPKELSALVTPQTLNPIFKALGLNPDMINQFVPSILGFAKEKGASPSLMQSLEKAWAPYAPQANVQGNATQSLADAKASINSAEQTAKDSVSQLKQDAKAAYQNASAQEKAQLNAEKDQIENALKQAESNAQQQSQTQQQANQEKLNQLKSQAADALNNLSDSLNNAAKNLQENNKN